MTNNKRKITPFQIKKIPKKEFNKLMKEYNDLQDVRSLYHFIKYLKNHDLIIVNKQFKKKAVNFSLKAVASVSFAGVIMTQILPKMNQDNTKIDLTPPETAIVEYTPEEVNISPVITPRVEEVNNTSMKILIPKASDTNTESDLKNYYKVKDKYGAYINKVSEEYGIDSRIITAMIAQENPNNKDTSNLGSRGPLCVSKLHDGAKYKVGHFVNDNYIIEEKTIDYDELNNKELYANGQYGNITIGEAKGIEDGVIIYLTGLSRINNNSNFSLEENAAYSIEIFNRGYSGVYSIIKDCSTIAEAYSNLENNYKKYNDRQYTKHVLNKIPDDEMGPFRFTSSDGTPYYVTFEKTNEESLITSQTVSKNHTL